MATAQLVVAGITGNAGFANEAAHNFADMVSYDAKHRAMRHENFVAAKRLRKLGAGLMLAGGLSSGGMVAYHGFNHHPEQASVWLVAAAVGGAAINWRVARRVEDAQYDGVDHDMARGSHHDGKSHAWLDARTGLVYAAGLTTQIVAQDQLPYAGLVAAGVASAWTAKTATNLLRGIEEHQ
jgi:hypothetical protein